MCLSWLFELCKTTRGPALTAARGERVASPLSTRRGVQKSQALTKGSNEWATFLLHLRLTPFIKRPVGGGSATSVASMSQREMWDKNSEGRVGAQPSHDHKAKVETHTHTHK